MTKWGRSSFKLTNLALEDESAAERWVEHNQKLFNREEVWFRVLKENSGWSPKAPHEGMFGSPPRDPGVWDVPWLQRYWNEETKKPNRVKAEHLTELNRRATEWMFKTSQETGCAFEIVIISTLKSIDRVGNGHIDHIIRQELIMLDQMKEKYPRATIMVNACNEWNAHSNRWDPWARREQISLRMVNMWAVRRDRDGYGWGELVVDHGGKNTFDYDVGPGRDTYDWGMLHPVRTGEWWEAPPVGPIRVACNGQPYGATESKFYVDVEDSSRANEWYRNRTGWTMNPDRMMEMYDNFEKAGFTYIIKAYQEILGRPADPGGLESYNQNMKWGLREADMRESLIRSSEYDIKNPESEDGL
jgi:hypothetical protein